MSRWQKLDIAWHGARGHLVMVSRSASGARWIQCFDCGKQWNLP